MNWVWLDVNFLVWRDVKFWGRLDVKNRLWLDVKYWVPQMSAVISVSRILRVLKRPAFSRQWWRPTRWGVGAYDCIWPLPLIRIAGAA